jgi:hypothetical protein
VADRAAAVEDFARRWGAFVQKWSRLRRRDWGASHALIGEIVRDGLPQAGRNAPAADLHGPDAAACARAVLAATDLFDAEGYAKANIRRLKPGDDPLSHYCREGWRQLCAPSLEFDLWWYWVEHLDPTAEVVDPLLHYALEGRRAGLSPVPPSTPTRPGTPPTPSPRRICLYAAYDRDGLVDPYVVEYLRELGRYADVYYLADGVLEKGELDKLAEVTRGAWCIPHAAYDFGSFSMLARDLVGWDVIDTYDELLLANDSCFLVRPLDEVFARMDARACDWWSLQATSMEHDESYVEDDAPIPLPEAKRRFIGPRQWTDVHYLHLSSYFLVFRAAVHRDPGFRWRLDTVSGQRDKQMVVHKYEVGISRYLMDAGFDFDTWADGLYAFHPLYSRHFFELLEQGFPLVKRNFLAENPRQVLGLEHWPERVRAAAPDAPIDLMRANIERVSPADRLALAYDLQRNGRGRPTPRTRPLPTYKVRTLDRETASHPHWWAFPVSAQSHRMDPGARSVFEAVRDDPSIRKVVLTHSRALRLDGENVVHVPITSLAGQRALVRCGRIFVDGPPGQAVPVDLVRRLHDYVHVGVGLPFAESATACSPEAGWDRLRGVAVSSYGEALVRVAGQPGLVMDQMWLTGLPRHDFVVRDSAGLPADLVEAEESLRKRLAGRRLLLWWTGGNPALDESQVARLDDWCRRNDVVLGVRERRVDLRTSLTHAFRDVAVDVIGASDRALADPSVLHRVASAIVTDGHPAAFDALLLGTPVLHLADPLDGRQVLPAEWPAELRPDALVRTGSDDLVDVLDERLEGEHGAPDELDGLGAVIADGHSGWRVAHRARSLDVDLDRA